MEFWVQTFLLLDFGAMIEHIALCTGEEKNKIICSLARRRSINQSASARHVCFSLSYPFVTRDQCLRSVNSELFSLLSPSHSITQVFEIRVVRYHKAGEEKGSRNRCGEREKDGEKIQSTHAYWIYLRCCVVPNNGPSAREIRACPIRINNLFIFSILFCF